MTQPQDSRSPGPRPRANLYSTAIDLPDETRIPVIQILNQTLADTTDLQSQAKFAHWNAKGDDFYQLHGLFDDLAEVLSEHVDLLAERVTALGSQAMGTTRVAASTSRIPEPPHDAVSEDQYLQWLADNVGRHANLLRGGIDRAAALGDEDSADLLTELSRDVDEQLYFLESHLQSTVLQQIPATAGPEATQPVQGGGGQPVRGTSPAGEQPPAGGQPPAEGQPATGGPPAQGGGPQTGSRPPRGGHPSPPTGQSSTMDEQPSTVGQSPRVEQPSTTDEQSDGGQSGAQATQSASEGSDDDEEGAEE